MTVSDRLTAGGPPPASLGYDVLADLALCRGTLDRASHLRTDQTLIPRLLADPATRVAVIVGDTMELAVDGPSPAQPPAPVDVGWTSPTGPTTTPDPVTGDLSGHAHLVLRPPVDGDEHRLAFFLGEELTGTGRTSYLAVVGDPTSAGHGEWRTLRDAGTMLGDRDAGIFTTTQALANWHESHQFCPRCGAHTRPEHGGWVRRCERDGTEHYPRTDPAVIMAVVDDDDRLLLGRGMHWPPGRFSVLAGFVEPGESFEAAVAREVFEEVGVAVTDVRYLGNQPWPFPSSGMIGFRARAVGPTDITLDGSEMAEARWVSRQEYVDLLRSGELRTPSGISIAQRLIEHWLGARVTDVLAHR